MKRLSLTIIIATAAFLAYSFIKKPSVDNNLGDVRYSILAPEVFEKLNPGWKLLSGQPMEKNWDLYRLLETEGLLKNGKYSLLKDNLPDARGMFIRGINNGRSATEGDPAGETAVGRYQDDTLKSHDHQLSFLDKTEGIVGFHTTSGAGDPHQQRITWGDRQPYGGAIANIIVLPRGGTETRPKNISLYIYIKVF